MNWNDHSKLVGSHALLGASKWQWTKASEERLINNYISSWATTVGTVVHEFASKRIDYKMKLDAMTIDTLVFWMSEHNIPYNVYDFNMVYSNLVNYVNDGIGYRMDTEKILYYSDLCFGTADAISFDNSVLRIHDLKTGVTPAHMEQLEIYAALFCLEYHIKPTDINTILRIYQCGEIIELNPDPKEIIELTKKIVDSNKLLNEFKEN